MRSTAALQICLSFAALAILATSHAQVKKPPFRVPVFNPKAIKGDSPLMKSLMIAGPRLSQEQGKASRPSVAVEGSNVYVVYAGIHDAADYLPQGNNVWYTHSDDGGLHFYPAKLVVSAGQELLMSPRIAVQNGHIWVGFIKRHDFSTMASLNLCESKDGGQSFSAPFVVEPNAPFGYASLEQDTGFNYLAVAGGAAFCAWGDTDNNVYMWKEGGGGPIRINRGGTFGTGRSVTAIRAADAEVYTNGYDVFVPYAEAAEQTSELVATFPNAAQQGPLNMPSATINCGSHQGQGRVEVAPDGRDSFVIAYTLADTHFNVVRVNGWKSATPAVINIDFTRDARAVPVPLPNATSSTVYGLGPEIFTLMPPPGGTALTWMQGFNVAATGWSTLIPSGSTTINPSVQVTKNYYSALLAAAQAGDKTGMVFMDAADLTTVTDLRIYSSVVGSGAATPARELYRDLYCSGLTLAAVGDHFLAFWRSGQESQADVPLLWAVVTP